MKHLCLNCGHTTECEEVTRTNKGTKVYPCYVCKNGCFKGCYCCEVADKLSFSKRGDSK